VKNKISDLRDHLFATIESLRDNDAPMELDRAKTIAEVAQVLINSAKVEVEAMKVMDIPRTPFIADQGRAIEKPPVLTVAK
jgi:hypothetical protein